jgi:hypothetical protein
MQGFDGLMAMYDLNIPRFNYLTNLSYKREVDRALTLESYEFHTRVAKVGFQIATAGCQERQI